MAWQAKETRDARSFLYVTIVLGCVSMELYAQSSLARDFPQLCALLNYLGLRRNVLGRWTCV